MKPNSLHIDPRDNVVTVMVDLNPGEAAIFSRQGGDAAAIESMTATEAIPYGHKIALVDLVEGDDVVKYGYSIGTATGAIARGCHVHMHNIRSKRIGEHA